jgi:hypothetical protein
MEEGCLPLVLLLAKVEVVRLFWVVVPPQIFWWVRALYLARSSAWLAMKSAPRQWLEKAARYLIEALQKWP